MAERKLIVLIEDATVGELREGSGIWRFAYSPDWTARGDAFPIGPGLPITEEEIVDTGTHRPVQWYFDNLLPEEGLRVQLAKEKKLQTADAFGLLEEYGAETAGSLTLLSPGAGNPPSGRILLNEDELFLRIKNLPKQSLEAKAPKKMSLAGAQHKLPVIFEKGAFFEPVGSEPSTHILKVNHRNTQLYPHTAANEWFVMQLAGRVGLSVPTTTHSYCPNSYFDEGNEPIFTIARFDRSHEGGKYQRIHSIDACQLLNLDRSAKYSAMSSEALNKVVEATRMRALTRLRLFEWTLFNLIVANADAHLKNLSFLVSGEGIDLAPHYDLLSTAIFDVGEASHNWADVPMSIKIGNASTFAEVTLEEIALHGDSLRITKAGVTSTIRKLVERIPIEADALLGVFEESPFPKTAAAVRGGEARVIRQIRHMPIKETIHRLG